MNVIAKTGYLGIDESNHGRFPEIFVAVHSEFDCDTRPAYSLSEPFEQRNKKKLPKTRNKKENIAEIIKKREFLYTMISRDFKDSYGFDGVRAVAYAELISRFDSLELVLIDRVVEDSVLEGMARIIHPRRLPEIISEPDADHRYPIVNAADRIANILYRYYQPFKNDHPYEKYSERLIAPKKLMSYSKSLKRLAP